MTVCNVHNYGFSFADTKAIKDFLFVLGSGIEVNPTCCIGILLGDSNIKAEHERSFKIGQTHFGGFCRSCQGATSSSGTRGATDHIMETADFHHIAPVTEDSLILFSQANVLLHGGRSCPLGLRSPSPCPPILIFLPKPAQELIGA